MTQQTTEPKTKPGSGICYRCGHQAAHRRYLGNHIQGCLRATSWYVGPYDDEEYNFYTHLLVSGSNVHWMDVLLRYDQTFRQLDQFLRDVWLECCDHLSFFRFGELRACSDGFNERDRNTYRMEGAELNSSDLLTFDSSISRTMLPGVTAEHEYDMGDTSYTRVTAQGYHVLNEDRPIVVMAQNLPIEDDPVNSPRWGAECFDGRDLVAPPRPVSSWSAHSDLSQHGRQGRTA